MNATRLLLAALLAIGTVACAADPSDAPRSTDERSFDEPPPRWSDAWILAAATRYLGDHRFRRRILEASLTNPDNIYSATRLSSYALAEGGWDALPVWNPQVHPVTNAMVDGMVAGAGPTANVTLQPLWDRTTPVDMPGWVELGRRVFFEYPLRPEVFALHALANPEVARAVGLQAAADGTWPGVVAFRDVDGRHEIGITCALCHVAIEDGLLVTGRARRDLDYGEMRLAYHRDTGAFLPAEFAERMRGWGKGRADITQDDDEDPVAIVDLWGVRSHEYLTQAATLRHVHPVALAIRQETQILHANRERIRPPRELSWALAMYVYSLAPPPRDAVVDANAAQGAALFTQHCRSCHSDATGGGAPVAAATVGTDPTLAFGHARGTGVYRPSPLVRVSQAGPYLHHGVVPTLAALLDPARLDDDYSGGLYEPGPVPGHRYGLDLTAVQRSALLGYLETL